jgi:thiol-disulfide isomerase/thioredoxin
MASEPPTGETPPDDDYKERAPWALRMGIGLAVVVIGGFFLLRPAADEGAEADSLPAFDLPFLTEEGSFTNADLQGKPVVINFWASWCGPCREETPLLQRTWEKYQDDLVILGVNLRDAPDNAKAFAEEFGVTYPLVVDEDQALYEQIAPIDGLPQTFFVDAEGRFLKQEETSDDGSLVLGAIEEEELEAQIEALLGTGS